MKERVASEFGIPLNGTVLGRHSHKTTAACKEQADNEVAADEDEGGSGGGGGVEQQCDTSAVGSEQAGAATAVGNGGSGNLEGHAVAMAARRAAQVLCSVGSAGKLPPGRVRELEGIVIAALRRDDPGGVGSNSSATDDAATDAALDMTATPTQLRPGELGAALVLGLSKRRQAKVLAGLPPQEAADALGILSGVC